MKEVDFFSPNSPTTKILVSDWWRTDELSCQNLKLGTEPFAPVTNFESINHNTKTTTQQKHQQEQQ